MSELPIVKALHDLSTELAGVNDPAGDKFTLPNVAATLIRELVEALEKTADDLEEASKETAIQPRIKRVVLLTRANELKAILAKAKQPI